VDQRGRRIGKDAKPEDLYKWVGDDLWEDALREFQHAYDACIGGDDPMKPTDANVMCSEIRAAIASGSCSKTGHDMERMLNDKKDYEN
jgi:hypothetical protein